MKLVLKAIFYLPGTFLHELAHYGAAAIMGKAEGFSVRPRKEGNSFIFGSVKSKVRYEVFNSFVASAPLVWWVVLFLLLRHLHFATQVNLPLLWKRIMACTLADAFYLWLLFQLFWAGRLSVQDIKNLFKGLFSPSGIALVSVVIGIFYLLKRVAPRHRFF